MAPSAVGHFNLSRVGSKERHPHRGHSSRLRQLIFKFISHLWTECVHYQQALHRPQTVLFPISPSTQSTDTGAEGSLGWGNRRKYRRKLHIGDLGEIFQRLSRTLSCTVLTGPPGAPVSCHTALNYLHMIRPRGWGPPPGPPARTNHQSQLRCVIVNDD